MYTYNYTDKGFYEEVWDLLVEEAGASSDPMDKDSFVNSYCQVEYPATEYRFGGFLGFGGKFWRNAGFFYVSCYREDETEAASGIIEKVNKLIAGLAKKHNPSRSSPAEI